CFTDGSVDVLKTTIPMSVGAVTATDEDLCTGPNGSGTVTAIAETPGPGNPANYVYTWSANADMSLPIVALNPAVTLNGLAAGTYYVQATKNAVVSPATPGVSGSGCETAPLPFTIVDRRVVPTVSFVVQSSTSCDGSFDGQITVQAATASGPGAGSTYDFLWQSDPGGAVVVNDALNVASPHTTGGADAIGPGLYTIRVRNTVTQCFTDADTEVLLNPQPVDILGVNKTDALICYPDGSITVSTISSGVPGNYTYEWYLNSPATARLQDNFATPIAVSSLVPGVAATQYPTMGPGAYFVKAIKIPGTGVGSGCATPPFRVDVLDLSTDPRVLFNYVPNSSCDPVNPNGIVIADASEQNGANGDTYSFTWQLNGAALPPATTETLTNNSSQLDNAFEGSYVLVVTNVSNTGCAFTSGLDVIKDTNLSTPNIVNTSTVDPLDCLNSGSAQVTGISINGGPLISGAQLATDFTYEWYAGAFPGGLTGTTTPNINAIGPGTYFVVARDNTTLCQSGPTAVEILDDAIVYPVIDIVQTAKQISCLPATGTAALSATADGSTGPNYTFDWFQNLTTTAPVFATTPVINNVVSGDYSLLVRNVTTNCTATAVYIVPDEAPLFTPEISTGGDPRTFCVGQDGSFLARVTNLSAQYPFPLNFTSDLYIGATPNLGNPADFPNMSTVPGFPANFIQTGLANGTYTVRLTDNNTGCVTVKTADILDNRTNPVVDIVEEQPLTICDPARANGQLAATADGGFVSGYSFEWVSGTTVPTPISGVILTDNLLVGRAAGSYAVRVTNTTTGCFADKSGSITDATVSPPVPNPSVVFDRTSCVTPDGWVTVSVGGVTLNYTFNWYNGTTAGPTPDFVGVDYIDVDIGTYAVTATDVVTGCVSAPANVDVLDKRTPPQFILSSTPSLCSDTGRPASGSLLMTPTIVDLPIDRVVWTEVATNGNAGEGPQVFGVYPGLYHVVVTTSEGCTNEGDVLVGTEIGAFNGVSANNDGFNNVFIIDCISNFPKNNVKIFNRSGILVYEANHYDNADVSFKGLGENGLYLQGRALPEGTYFYIIDKGDGSKLVSGYLELTR
ncbi:MAG: gliding motility-associated C-terminal domain-containing protein, partial [Cyclobacteriaceae bacterium]|nr:gliding motility-associated C-terminal domain-containing protein [Cyclobacteriaceae bacterium]